MAGRTNPAAGAKLRVRAAVAETGRAHVATGVSILDHLVGLLAKYASFDLVLEVQPGAAADEVAAAGRALGEALAEPLRQEGVRGHGSAAVPADEAWPTSRSRPLTGHSWSRTSTSRMRVSPAWHRISLRTFCASSRRAQD